MDAYVTGATIKRLREAKGYSQAVLAEKLSVTDKAVSRWETSRGYPDITLLEPLSEALGVTVLELLNGEAIINTNRAGNMRKTRLYVCPVCGNCIFSAGETVIACCGISLPALEAEAEDEEHKISCEPVEDEWYVSMDHPMTKTHSVAFFAFVQGDSVTLHKLYPEGNAQTRFKRSGHGTLYAYCNRHGLYKKSV